ncbi:hypothetical protein AQUCO_03300135v1 [Aquilegia coerulea]|uniref:Bifunctional inhibitor/plant lipid transfer protein/seed storage helical domain-containing protein n=1 Tax=Aquilegia coerulea TaxID=218851 RepID=A0A2G5CZL9_AQUCA|nr:hypothetical protein AQUCO_03300135v1 [Aquilegia coerulea]
MEVHYIHQRKFKHEVGSNLSLVLAMIQLMVEPSQAVNCAQVDLSLRLVVTTADKRQTCNCVKQAISLMPNIKGDAVSSLSGKCGTPLSFPISKDFDCNSIP